MDLLRTLPYLLPYLISLALSMGVGVYAWRRRDVSGAAAFAICVWTGAMWTVSHIFELLNPGLEDKIFWSNVEFIGLFLAPMALLVFALQFTGCKLAHPGRLLGLLAIVPTLSMLLIFTDPFHGLVRPSASLIPGGPFSELDFGYSIPLWGMSIYAFGLNIASILILVAQYIRSPRLYRSQIGAVMVGCLLPLLGAIPILMNLRLAGHRDIMPLLFGVGSLIGAWGLFRYRLHDIVPVAHDLVIKSMSDATLVLDAQDRLVDLNPAAQALVGHPVSEIVGQPAEQIFSHWHALVERYQGVEDARAEVAAHVGSEQRYFDYRLSPLRDQRGRLMGRLVVVRDVTEYKRAAEALKLSEEKYRALVENINDVIFSTDIEGHLTYISPSVEQFALYSVSEIVGQPFARFVHPDDLPGLTASFERTLAGTLEPSEFRIFAKDGTVLHVRTSSRPLSVGDRVVGISGILVNLTQRKQAEEELEKRRRQLEKLVEERTAELKASNEQLQQEVAERKWTAALQLALYRISSEASAARNMQDFYAVIHNIIGTLMYTGNFYIALYDEGSQTLRFPYFVDEIDSPPPPSSLRKGLTDYVVRSGQPLLATPEVFQQLVDQGEVELFGAPSVDWLGVPLKSAEKTIGVIVVQSYHEGIRFSEKEKNLLMFVSQQIASALERKRAEEALRESEQLLSKTFASLHEAIFIIDAATTKILDCNPAAPEVFGYTREEMLGQTTTFLHVDEAGLEEFRRHLRPAVEEKGFLFLPEFRMKRKDGTIIFTEHGVTPLEDERGERVGWVSVVRDISERKRAEEALQRRAAQLAILNDVGTQIVAELALNNVLDRATHLIQESFGYHHVAIFTVDREQGQAVMKTRAGLFVNLFPPDHHLKLGQGMIGWVAQHGELLLANDVDADPHYINFYANRIPTHSELSVPIRVGQDIVGVLDAQSPQRGAFDENDVMVMETLADQIALAMVNARLYESVRQELEERRRAEEALRESEAQYRSLFENSPISLWEEDFSRVKAHLDDLRASGVADFREYFASHPEAVMQCASLVRIYNVNQATLNLYKAKTREELYGGLDRVFVDESFSVFREELLTLIEGRTRFESEVVGQPLTGDSIKCIVGVSIAPGYEDTWAKVFVSVADITERVRTEAALHRHMVRMGILHEIDRSILVAQSPEATAQAALDRLRQLTGCPRASVSLFDFQANQVWALAISSAVPTLNAVDTRYPLDAFGLHWIKLLQEGRSYVAEDILKLPEISEVNRRLAAKGLRAWLGVPLVYQGELIGSLNLGASEPGSFDAEMIDLAGQVADQLAIAIQQARLLEQVQRHTTELEQRVAERTAELRAAYERLQTLDRIKDEFVSNVSHELRTPIASIKLYLHMLDLRPDKHDSYMGTLERETARLEDLIENILTLSRLDQGRVEINSVPVDLNTLVGEYVTDRTPLAESKGLTLAFKPASRMQPVKADHHLLGQVLGILLTNALSYTPPGGQIVVHTRKRRFAGRWWAGFSVSDTGPGVPPEEQLQLFTRFFRGKVGRESGTPGTGLGLAIAKEIVERHQGQIELDGKNTRNKGATFCVWLPVSVS